MYVYIYIYVYTHRTFTIIIIIYIYIYTHNIGVPYHLPPTALTVERAQPPPCRKP